MDYLKKIAIPSFMMLWCVYFIHDAGPMSKKGNTFVWAVFILLCVVFAVELFNEFRRTRAEGASGSNTSEHEDHSGLIRSFVVFIATLLYIILMRRIGFAVSTFVYLAAMFLFLKAKNKFVVLIASAVITGIMWAAFYQLLGVPLPKGILF